MAFLRIPKVVAVLTLHGTNDTVIAGDEALRFP